MASAWTRSATGSAHAVTHGITDLMTSLAVIFVLLLVVFANASRSAEHAERGQPGASPSDQVRAALAEASPRGLALEPDPLDPHALRVIIPSSVLNFELGKSALTPAGDRFLARLAPAYATTLCGPLGGRVAGVVIEGHTDDLGGDALNLRLSQERSFHVLVRALEAIRASAPGAHDCFSALASASGRGKRDLVYDTEGRPDRDLSRRVVFKIVLRASVRSPVAPSAATPNHPRAAAPRPTPTT